LSGLKCLHVSDRQSPQSPSRPRFTPKQQLNKSDGKGLLSTDQDLVGEVQSKSKRAQILRSLYPCGENKKGYSDRWHQPHSGHHSFAGIGILALECGFPDLV
jgi:hypothetical protein